MTSTTEAVAPEQAVLDNFSRAELEGQAANLRRQLADSERRNQVVMNDIRMIAAALRSEAMERDWCSAYGDFVEEWNGQLSQPWLEHCMMTRVMVFEVSVEIECRTVTDSSDVGAELTGYLGDSDISLDTNGASVNSVNCRLLRNDPA